MTQPHGVRLSLRQGLALLGAFALVVAALVTWVVWPTQWIVGPVLVAGALVTTAVAVREQLLKDNVRGAIALVGAAIAAVFGAVWAANQAGAPVTWLKAQNECDAAAAQWRGLWFGCSDNKPSWVYFVRSDGCDVELEFVNENGGSKGKLVGTVSRSDATGLSEITGVGSYDIQPQAGFAFRFALQDQQSWRGHYRIFSVDPEALSKPPTWHGKKVVDPSDAGLPQCAP